MTCPSPYQIKTLLECPPDDAKVLAEWEMLEWSKENAAFGIHSVEDALQELHKISGQVFVATVQGVPVGTGRIIKDDMAGYESHGWTPWVASLYVDGPARGGGVARLLLNHILHFAKDTLRLPRIYLYCNSGEKPYLPDFYAKMGFRLVQKLTYLGSEVSVMVQEF